MKCAALISVLLVLALAACGNKPSETSTQTSTQTSTGTSAENPATVVSKIDITSPADGAKLATKAQNNLDYNITLGGDGDHVHAYVDNSRVAMLREMKGSYPLEYLEQGKREICIKIVNRNHTPIGVDRCVTIVVE